MSFVRFEPWSLFDQFHSDVDRPARRDAARAEADPGAGWAPPVDIVELKDRFIVRADVPGVDPADLDVSLDDGVLAVSGDRQREQDSEVEGLRRYERSTGRFLRRFTLPRTVDAEGITARCNNGILEVVIPKQPEVRARRIDIEAA
jgi:HSP20 family protein